MKKFTKIVIATRNPAKIQRYTPILYSIAHEILSLNDLNLEGKPAESGNTSEENAQIKASYYSEKCGLPVFTEDEALYVDFLAEKDQPATHVRRINGKEEVDDDTLLKHWESIISKVEPSKRTGKWHISYCIATPDGKSKVVGVDHKVMFFSPSSKVRIQGWPMSSLNGSILIKKPHSEQTKEERNIVDNAAFNELKAAIKKLI
jgi:inosine/xanthosine triphosphate pyrophosphatase family protein